MTKLLFGCAARKGEERDGYEFQITSLEQFINILKKYKDVHLNYFGNEDDLDLWVKVY